MIYMGKDFNLVEKNAWVGFVRASQHVMELVEQALKEGGFPPLVWYDALLELDFASERKLRLSELGERMLLKKFSVTRLVDRMEAEGYVARTTCDSDARGTYAEITSKGKKLRRIMWPCYREAVRQCFLKHMSEKEMQMLSALIERIQK
jgi:DNA-binding MarR family transcriptional regulator